jgi:hypothetical protein
LRRAGAAILLALAASFLGSATAVASGPPSIGAGAVTNIQGVSALLTGKVNPNGLDTHYRFQYITDQAFAQDGGGFGPGTQSAPTPEADLGAASQDRAATAAISGLAPDTTYHYRLTATNSAGTTLGPEATFTTTHGFGFLPGPEGFNVEATKLDGTPATQAGSHPYELTTTVNLNPGGEFAGQPGVPFPDGDVRDLRFELPPGLIGNPTVVRQCTLAQFDTPHSSPLEAQHLSGESCPAKSQVGVLAVHSSFGGGQTRSFGLFNLTPPPGVAVELGAAPFGEPLAFAARVRTAAAQYGLDMEARNIPQTLSLDGAKITLWGTPWAISHNPERGDCLNESDPGEPWAKCSVGPPRTNRPQAFLTLPDSCSGPLSTTASADSWQQPATVTASSSARDEAGQPLPLSGCERLSLQTTSFAQPATLRASSATGFEFDLEVDQEGLLEPALLAPSQVRNAVVSLPEGMTINPSVGAGLGVCTPAQYEAESAGSAPGSACPNESKIGDFRVETPLLEEALNGSIFLAQPFHNPFGSLIGLYLITRSSQRGIIVKVAGQLVPDRTTGRLTAIFEDLPQLPYAHIKIHFREGQRAPLASPAACGLYSVRDELTPWLDPEAIGRHSFEFPISQGVGGGPCPGAGAPPFTPAIGAGTLNSNAGSYSPFYLHLTRTDTEQEITSYSALLPPGLTGKLTGIPYCPEADLAAAKAKSGVEELEHPSCPAASEVGHTVTGYGLGGVLTYAPGKLYLTGPYHGAPLSITAVDSALVGPFDLGVIIVRSAIEVNPITAQVSIDSAASDPIPHIREGIPLHLRDIRVYISRPNFTLNPTNCQPFRASSTLTGSSPPFADPKGASATASGLFQVSNCSALRFAPKLSLKLLGGARRGAFPALRATVTERPGDANIGRAIVALPHTEFLAQAHIREICTLRQFDAEACPPSSVYGHATAYTPLLPEPLQGPVYLRSSSAHPLPDMVAALRGDGGIAIDLSGRVDSTKGGGLRASFEVLPDAPASKFVMTLDGGKKGLLENSTNVCTATAFASAQFVGQNNAEEALKVPLGADCRKHRKGKPHHKRQRRLR